MVDQAASGPGSRGTALEREIARLLLNQHTKLPELAVPSDPEAASRPNVSSISSTTAPVARAGSGGNGPKLAVSGSADGTGRSRFNLTALRSWKTALVISIVLAGFLVYIGVRAQVTAKSMIDHNSVGVDYLNIAYNATGQDRQQRALMLAAKEFAMLRSQLDSWSWIVSLSSIVPLGHDQFVVMDRMADLGGRMAEAKLADQGDWTTEGYASPTGICISAGRLKAFDGRLLAQLEKNRTELLASVPVATGGLCTLN